MKKFKIGQHIRLKSLPNSNIEIIDINNAGYIYMGDAVVNGSIIGKEQKVIPFEYEDDYEVIDCGEKKSMKIEDEQKAREIIGCGDWCESINKCDYKNGVNCYAYGIAMKMAAWKEQQVISQMKEFIAEYFYEHPHTSWLICSDEFQDLDDCFERLERYLKEE